MSYRPPNWNSEKIMDDVLAKHYPHDCSMFGTTINKFFIEGGADAILEALKGDALVHVENGEILDSNIQGLLVANDSGSLVIIPEEESDTGEAG